MPLTLGRTLLESVELPKKEWEICDSSVTLQDGIAVCLEESEASLTLVAGKGRTGSVQRFPLHPGCESEAASRDTHKTK